MTSYRFDEEEAHDVGPGVIRFSIVVECADCWYAICHHDGDLGGQVAKRVFGINAAADWARNHRGIWAIMLGKSPEELAAA